MFLKSFEVQIPIQVHFWGHVANPLLVALPALAQTALKPEAGGGGPGEKTKRERQKDIYIERERFYVTCCLGHLRIHRTMFFDRRFCQFEKIIRSLSDISDEDGELQNVCLSFNSLVGITRLQAIFMTRYDKCMQCHHSHLYTCIIFLMVNYMLISLLSPSILITEVLAKLRSARVV